MQELLEFAVAIAREAGRSTLTWFRSPDLEAELKRDRSPVTRADREAEELLRGRIEAACPGDGILGEEFMGPHPTPHPWLVLALNAPWVLVPAYVIKRMWNAERPFTETV